MPDWGQQMKQDDSSHKQVKRNQYPAFGNDQGCNLQSH
jgi:hypothetical protein